MLHASGSLSNRDVGSRDRIYIYTYTYTYIYAYAYTHIHRYICAHICTQVGSRAYMTLDEAKRIWTNEISSKLGLQPDAQVLDDALQLLVNQGEIFSSCGIIYLQPNYVTRLLKPLVDHRLGKNPRSLNAHAAAKVAAEKKTEGDLFANVDPAKMDRCVMRPSSRIITLMYMRPSSRIITLIYMRPSSRIITLICTYATCACAGAS